MIVHDQIFLTGLWNVYNCFLAFSTFLYKKYLAVSYQKVFIRNYLKNVRIAHFWLLSRIEPILKRRVSFRGYGIFLRDTKRYLSVKYQLNLYLKRDTLMSDFHLLLLFLEYPHLRNYILKLNDKPKSRANFDKFLIILWKIYNYTFEGAVIILNFWRKNFIFWKFFCQIFESTLNLLERGDFLKQKF